MSADSMYAAKRAAEGKPWKSGFCAARMPKSSHVKCHGGYDRQIDPVGWVPCACDCHTDSEAAGPEPVASDQTPAGQPPGVEPRTVLTDPPALTVTEPCVIDDMTDVAYHADPVTRDFGGSLSNSGAKLLHTQTPAHFAWYRQHGRPPKKSFTVGHAVHTKVLGVGADVVVIDGNRNANAVKAEIAEAEAKGHLVLKSAEHDAVVAMADAVLAHKSARFLFEASTVREQSIFWQDTFTGMYLRCRPDSRVTLKNGRRILVDLKTADNADPAAFGRTADNFGYVQQHPFYLAGAQAHDLVDADSTFVFVLVEKDPPYLVSVVELDDDAIRVGRQRNRKAIDVFADCTESNDWPGYSPDVVPVSLPYWTVKQHDEEYSA